MKKILFTLAAFAIIFASCTKDMVTPEPEARLMRVTATVQEPADTRATLEEVGTGELKSIRFKWETSDVIQMAFVQGNAKTDNMLVSRYKQWLGMLTQGYSEAQTLFHSNWSK